jgi:enoyl-CoA hydratase/carnithine racemase
LRGGLVKAVVPQEDLLPAALAVVRDMAENTAPVSAALIRHMMWRMLGADHPMEAHKIDSRLIFQRGKSADTKEGVTSFLEKRQPHFPDKVSRDMPSAFPWWAEREYE